MDYTIAELEELIRDASTRGRVDLVKFYNGHLDRLRAEEAHNN